MSMVMISTFNDVKQSRLGFIKFIQICFVVGNRVFKVYKSIIVLSEKNG